MAPKKPDNTKDARRRVLEEEDELTLPPGISPETATWMRIQARSTRVVSAIGDTLDEVEERMDRLEAAVRPGVAAGARLANSLACAVEEITRAFRAVVGFPGTMFRMLTRENPVAQTAVVLGGFILGAAAVGVEIAAIDVNALFRDVIRPCDCAEPEGEPGGESSTLLPSSPDAPTDTLSPIQ